jgi:NADPH-dependent curcumin reductase CurA
VIGIAGTDAKVRYLVEDLGFDGAFNYKKTSDYGAKIKELCPKGVDGVRDLKMMDGRFSFFGALFLKYVIL